MIRLQRCARLPAIRTRPVPELKKPDPLDGRVRSRRPQFASMAASIGSLTDIAVFASVLRKIGGKSFLVAFVMGPHLRGVLSGVSLPPPPHGFPGFLWVAPHPLTAVLAPTFGVLMRHGGDLAARQTRGNRTQQKSAALAAALLLRGNDSNVRPSGYEPDELPLLHPANQFYL